jgi:hypothetical protein
MSGKRYRLTALADSDIEDILAHTIRRSGGGSSLGRTGAERTSEENARYTATRPAPPRGTTSKGSRILTIVPVPSDPDAAIVPPS